MLPGGVIVTGTLKPPWRRPPSPCPISWQTWMWSTQKCNKYRNISALLRSTNAWHSKTAVLHPQAHSISEKPCPVTSVLGNCQQLHNTNQDNLLLNHPSQAMVSQLEWEAKEQNAKRGTRVKSSHFSEPSIQIHSSLSVSEAGYRWFPETQDDGLLRDPILLCFNTL